VPVFPVNFPVNHLEVVTDTALDCTHLVATTEAAAGGCSGNGKQFQQARLLIEQRSTGFAWPSHAVSGLTAPVNGSAFAKKPNMDTSPAVSGLSKSRLSGLKQISVAGLANLRQRINEGRKMLDRRVSSSSLVHASNSDIEIGQEATETIASLNSHQSSTNSSGVEPLSGRVGGTRVSVIRPSDGGPAHVLVYMRLRPFTISMLIVI